MRRNLEDCTVGIAGLGLMGGAIARSLRNNCGVEQERLFACDKDSETLNAAKEAGLIAQGFEAEKAGEMLKSCDLVFLCLNPSTIIGFLEKWEGAFKTGCLITDIAGTKGSIAAAAEKFRKDVDFIPGHPMAGAEKGGFANSQLCNFNGKNYILTPLSRNKSENLQFLKDLIYKMGFGRITEVTPGEHDRKIAFTSQLCHVIASALIDCEEDTAITRFGGGSFEDLTRIAMLNAPMWTELFIENRGALLDRIEQFEKSLDALKSLISGAQAAELEKRLELVRDRRTVMSI
ncbi:MAG: prephenate dehydrogenase [Treponema sp.]|nr:prephenate dehydrogenase [Treponema sp.]